MRVYILKYWEDENELVKYARLVGKLTGMDEDEIPESESESVSFLESACLLVKGCGRI